MAKEMDLPTLQKLCHLIAVQWKAELAYHRAQYRVSYYQKLKAKLNSSKKTNEKWNDHIELAKKIESERLISLKKQEQLLTIRKKLKGPMGRARDKLGAKLTYANGERKIVAIYLPTEGDGAPGNKWRNINSTEIAEYAEQYETETAFNKILASKGNTEAS